MLSPVASTSSAPEPKMYSATYVENYLDSVENLPNEVQRFLSRIREIDMKYQAHLRDVDHYYDLWSNIPPNDPNADAKVSTKRSRAMGRIKQALIAATDLGDEKLRITTQLQEVIDLKTRQLESDYNNLDYADKDDPGLRDSPSNEGSESSPSSYAASTSNANQKDDVASGTSEKETKSGGGGKAAGATAASKANEEKTASNWKRSRRARESTARNSSNNSFANSSKTNIDLESGNSNSNQSKGNAGGAAGGSTTASRNRSGNNGNKNTTKKRKRTSGRTNNGNGGNNSSNAATSAQNAARVQNPVPLQFEETIDPDEPTYCLCDQISFGEMILCDNDLCPIEWFHFSCVSLTTKPKGKWFCPNCRGDRPSVMKPKQQFLKELERYNREKERP